MNPDGTADLLSQLRDIHGAPEAAFWPPAPGWWVLAALLLLLLVVVLRALHQRLQARRRRRDLLLTLQTLRERYDPQTQPHAWLSALNRLLKVTAMRVHPGDRAGSLTGDAWVGYLGEDEAFAPLASGPYRPAPEFDADRLEAAAQRWLRRHG